MHKHSIVVAKKMCPKRCRNESNIHSEKKREKLTFNPLSRQMFCARNSHRMTKCVRFNNGNSEVKHKLMERNFVWNRRKWETRRKQRVKISDYVQLSHDATLIFFHLRSLLQLRFISVFLIHILILWCCENFRIVIAFAAARYWHIHIHTH